MLTKILRRKNGWGSNNIDVGCTSPAIRCSRAKSGKGFLCLFFFLCQVELYIFRPPIRFLLHWLLYYKTEGTFYTLLDLCFISDLLLSVSKEVQLNSTNSNSREKWYNKKIVENSKNLKIHVTSYCSKSLKGKSKGKLVLSSK